MLYCYKLYAVINLKAMAKWWTFAVKWVATPYQILVERSETLLLFSQPQ